MSALVNPSHRNMPCEQGPQESSDKMPPGEPQYFCSRCGAQAVLAENLCAPMEA